MIVAQRSRPSLWSRLLSRLSPRSFSHGEAQQAWDDAWLDRCRERAGEPYLRLVHSTGQVVGRRFGSIDPTKHRVVDDAGNVYDEYSPLQRLEQAIAQGALPYKAFSLPLEGLTKGGRRRYEWVLNAEFPDACILIQARLEDAQSHPEGNAEALSSRSPDPLYPSLPRHWKEMRTALDWCLLLGDDEAIERLGLVHTTLSEQDQFAGRRDVGIPIKQTSVLPSSTHGTSQPPSSYEKRWHRTARRLEALDEALEATAIGLSDEIDVPHISRSGDFRAIVDSADIDALDADGRHVYHAFLEGRDGALRAHADATFWKKRYAIGGRDLPQALEASPSRELVAKS